MTFFISLRQENFLKQEVTKFSNFFHFKWLKSVKMAIFGAIFRRERSLYRLLDLSLDYLDNQGLNKQHIFVESLRL